LPKKSQTSTNGRFSKFCYVPCAVSSFFEICDQHPDGSSILDPLRIGARGGGFKVEKGNITRASFGEDVQHDVDEINGIFSPEAITTLSVLSLMRKKHDFPYVKIAHRILPPVGSGFGTSGAGALGTALAVNELCGLHLTLSQASAFAHMAEIRSTTGLGTVISLASGGGPIGLVTEPGSYSIGKTDSILADCDEYVLICAVFGPIQKSTVLSNKAAKNRVNSYGRKTLEKILEYPSPETLLKYSREFCEKAGLGSPELLKLSDKAVKIGALGATPNMIGNAIHCLVLKSNRSSFLKKFVEMVPRKFVFESTLARKELGYL